MDIEIRKANIKDLSKIQELNRRLFELENELFDPNLNVDLTYDKIDIDYFKNMVENGIVFLAINNNEIVGYLAGSSCSLSYTKSKFAKLDNIFVLEDYRKYGIGTKLINKFKQHCLNNGMETIKVTTYAKNKNAISFYLKNGFDEWDITLSCKLSKVL
jgi:GNAT superfamily N-acetyltransferase